MAEKKNTDEMDIPWNNVAAWESDSFAKHLENTKPQQQAPAKGESNKR